MFVPYTDTQFFFMTADFKKLSTRRRKNETRVGEFKKKVDTKKGKVYGKEVRRKVWLSAGS